MAERKFCSPECRFFRCEKRAITYRGNRAWCNWAEELCIVSSCSYAICVKRRLLHNGICGETVKRKTIEKSPEEDIGPEIRFRGKTLRRLGKDDVF